MRRCLVPLLFLLLSGSAAAGGQTPPGVQEALGRLQAGDAAGAEGLLRDLTTREPDNGRAWSLLGQALRQLSRYDEAVAAYTRAAELTPGAPAVLLNGGLALAQAGNLDEAFAWLREARDSGAVDVTSVDLDPAAAVLREDPRYATLFPSAEELEDPFVEPTRIIHEWRGEGVNDQFGWIARNIGDVDGDGVNDVTTSAPTWGSGGRSAGRVYVYSGRTGGLLWTADGEAGDQLGLGIEAAGDVNGDGVPDVVAGAPGADRALVFSGTDGVILHDLHALQPGEWFGRKVGDVGDVDRDGHDDILVGAPRNDVAGTDAGRAYLLSGRSGDVLLTLTGEEAGDAFGSSAGGHVSEDGLVTLVVGAPNAGPGDRGATYVYHGLTAEPAFVITSDESGAQLGAMFVSAVGDVDADGTVDVYASDWSAGTNGPGSGRVYVHSGADGRLLYDLAGEAAGDGFGIGVADAGDVDGDGHDDLVIGAWQYGGAAPSGGKVYLYSGRDGSLVRTITGKVMGETFGFDTTGMGDVDGDGVPDLLLTSAWSAVAGGRSGRMYIVAGTKDGAR
ncbi:MAG: FG-GAP-like repeat-containing protein [Gemmatimonadota bacterium]|jgi:hypothetical protein